MTTRFTKQEQRTAAKKAAQYIATISNPLVVNYTAHTYFGTLMGALEATGADFRLARDIKQEAFYDTNIYLPGDFEGASRIDIATFLLLLAEVV